jgi:hypothetical protein
VLLALILLKGSIPIDRHTACPIGGAAPSETTARPGIASRILKLFSIMSIPTCLEVPEERGVCNFTQSVTRAIVYPSHCSASKLQTKNSRRRFIYYIMQLSVRVWRKANNEIGHKINDFFQLRKTYLLI